MRARILVAGTLAVALVGLGVWAGPLSGSWLNEMTFTVDKATEVMSPFSFDSIFTLNYAFCGFVGMSFSEFYLPGFIWQGFGLTGALGAFDIQADVLFGPSTVDFLYAQEIVTATIAGMELGWYWAMLSDAVLGGPADGSALRLAGSFAGCDIVSITEFQARIKDENFDGITIVHAATGLSRSYDTFPISTPQTGSSCTGWSGEKLTISGMRFACIEELTTTVYLTCDSGFEWVRFEVEEICTGLSWLSLDLELTFNIQTKSIVVTPSLLLGDCACIDTYLDIRTGADDDTLYGAFTSLTGISLYGIGVSYTWQGVTFKALTVLDTGRYAITTPAYGSVIEKIADAVDEGHDFYPDYWELYSIKVVQDGCCGGLTSFLANTYFDEDSTGIFDWALTHVEVEFAVNPTLFLTGLVELDTAGLNRFGFGVEVGW